MEHSLRSYELQLEQVEAALVNSPHRDELVKLKSNIQIAISLAKNMFTIESAEDTAAAAGSSNISRYFGGIFQIGPHVEPQVRPHVEPQVRLHIEPPVQPQIGPQLPQIDNTWQVGDRCKAKWRGDKKYYVAVIVGIDEDTFTVKYDGYKTVDLVSVEDIKPIDSVKQHTKKEKYSKKYREYLQKKKEKRQERLKQQSDEREKNKTKWLKFQQSKATKKPWVRSKSIFASPNNEAGRVGVGTCGISGLPMTEYTQSEKWKKGG
ncbi:survival of motor neuron-related-splicing factor 30-like [Anticarsia gemmatalis]|uniref:survival of motor neuron-related-splicing factor 30-like n=1 Tax=Anticarsia gemmatalis TaxID=129554 RepID=UPI003F7724C2